MPRRNHTPKIQRQPVAAKSELRKTQYASRQAAKKAISTLRIYRPDVQLRAYQSLADGKWYLTSTDK